MPELNAALENQSNLSTLKDVGSQSPNSGDVLTWNGSEWVPQVGGGGGGASSLNDLSDVDTATNPPNNGEALIWNGSLWTPHSVVTSINDLTDVDTATDAPNNGEALVWNGGQWVPQVVATSTIYTADGTITSDRMVNIDTRTLTFYAGAAELSMNDMSCEIKQWTSSSNNARIKVNTTGVLDFKASQGWDLNGAGVGSLNQVLTSQGAADPVWMSVSNIYNADGTIDGVTRTVDIINNGWLKFTNNHNSINISDSYAIISGDDFNGNESSFGAYNSGMAHIGCTSHLSINGASGNSGEVLTSQGSGQPPVWSTPSGAATIYTADGMVSGARTVSLGGNSVWFKEDSNYSTFISSTGFQTKAQYCNITVNDTHVTIENISANNVGAYFENDYVQISSDNGADGSRVKCNAAGILVLSGTQGIELNNTVGTSGQVMVSNGSAQPTWGMINMTDLNGNDLPTADPGVSGKLWNDGGVVKVSP